MRKLLILLCCSLVLAGCDFKTPTPKASFINTDVTGLGFGKDFALTDHTGQPRTLADYKGKVVAVFFGYTQCPDVCPTTLAEMAQVKQQLGADGDRLQVLFITVDPERDTQDVLAGFVPAIDPSFVGLRGNTEQTEQAQKEFKIFAQKVKGKDGKSYTIDHTAATYLIDPQGQMRLFVHYGQDAQSLLKDIRQLLSSA
jgi:protein SCO1/2